MGNFFVSVAGVALGFCMIKYRERVAEVMGEPDWMHKFGGVYNVIMISAVLIIFFSLAKMTGTTDIFLAPLMMFVPGGNQPVEAPPTF